MSINKNDEIKILWKTLRWCRENMKNKNGMLLIPADDDIAKIFIKAGQENG